MIARVLAVDDLATVRHELRTVLEAEGYRIHEAADGQSALRVLEAGTLVDMIITDFYMPDMDGLSLVRRVRRLERHQSTPILVLTIEDDEHMRQRGRAAGASAWLVKPWQPDELRRTVRELLERAASGGPV